MTVQEVVGLAETCGLKVQNRDGDQVWTNHDGKKRCMLELVPFLDFEKPPFSQLAGKMMILNPAGILGDSNHPRPVPLKRCYWTFTCDDGEAVIYWYAPVVEDEEGTSEPATAATFAFHCRPGVGGPNHG